MELATALTEIDEALRGRGRSLLITGGAGIGKTVFVEDVVASASPEWLVVRIEGAEQESRMVWAGVSQLVHHLSHHLTELRPAHREIIEVVVDPTSGEAPDPFAAAVSVHALVAQAAETRPLAIVIDDHHWLDPDSARVFDFVGRRLDGIPAIVIASSRSDDVKADRRIELLPLRAQQAAELLTGLGLAVVAAHELADRIGGHPFALVHAAKALTESQRNGVEPLPSPFPMSSADLPSTVATIIDGLPETTFEALHLLAAAGVLGRRWDAVLTSAGASVDSLTPAEDAAVITISADALRFTHPLFRAAVYAHATPAERRAGHRLLAEIEPDRGRALWHTSRAVIGHDDAIAAQLAEVAEEAFNTGAYTSAFEAWHRAGELSSTHERAEEYEILAAEAALRAGNNGPASDVIHRVPPTKSTNASLVRLAAVYEARAGHPDAAHNLFVRAGELLERDQPDRAAHAYIDAARTSLRTGQIHTASAALARLDSISGRIDSPNLVLMVDVIRAFIESTASGSNDRFVNACRMLAPGGGGLVGDLSFLADTVALGLAFRHQRDEAITLIERLRATASDRSLPSLIPFLDTAKACALSAVDLPGCMIAATNALEWADAMGQPSLATAALGYLANVQAALGDPGMFDSANRIGAIGTEHGWVSEHLLRGFYWTTLGQPERVLEELLPLHEWAGGELKTVLFWHGDLGEAAVRAGRIDLARAVVEQLGAFNEIFPNPWLAGAAARIEGLLADIDECGHFFELSSDAFASADIRLGQARSELLWGERLRRARRRSEARPHLVRAHSLFRQIGAGRWAERCEHELVAAGGATHPADHSHDADRVLTPQELQIARLCVAGHSNRDIGAAVFISTRTVETHLSAIYRKLAVKNRAALAAAAANDPALRGPNS